MRGARWRALRWSAPWRCLPERLITRSSLAGLLGGACAIVCFLLLGLTVQHIVEEGAADQKRGKKRMRVSYLLRLLLMAAVFIVAVEAPVFNWVAAAVMLLAPRAVVMIVPAIEHFKKKKQDKTQETL